MKYQHSVVAAALAISLGFAAGAVNAAPAAASLAKNAYGLTVKAMQDVKKVTDVYVTVTPNSPNSPTYDPAGDVKHLQLKSFDTSGNLRWTKNEFDVPLKADDNGTTAVFSYNDMGRYQPVQAQAQVQTTQTLRTLVLNGNAPVLLRPDLTVDSISADKTVQVGQVVNISAVIKELNGDLGAAANVSLSNGTEQLDSVSGANVNPNGDTTVVFSTRFMQAGTYTLTVSIDSSKPGDYDTSNNTKTVTITAIAGAVSVPYSMSYYDYHIDYSDTWNYWWGNGTANENYMYEYVTANLSLGANTTLFPLNATLDIRTDGNTTPVLSKAVNDVNPAYSWSSGCYAAKYASVDLGDDVYLYAQNYSYCGTVSNSVSYTQYATDYVYMSAQYSIYWGNSNYTENYHYGVHVSAGDSVHSRFVVQTGDGQSYGGEMEIPSLTSSPINYSWNYSGSDGTSSGSEIGTSVYGYANGMTQ